MKSITTLLFGLILIAVTGCTSEKKETAKMELDNASGLEINMLDGYTKIDVKDPWQPGKFLQSYILVHRDSALPEELPQGTLVRVPLQKVLVYSDVHATVMNELGCIDAVNSVCDAKYFKTEAIVKGVASNMIEDCGSSMAPSVEKIVSQSPEAVLLSPFQNAGYGVLENIGVPIIELADYMEQTPLGRAEWIKFLGLLFDKQELAFEIYDKICSEYQKLKEIVPQNVKKPRVLVETVMSGVWYVPGGQSYRANMLKDAGADYPWADNESSGSLPLDFPQVLNKAADANIWLINTWGTPLTNKSLLGIYPHNDQIKAYSESGVYYADTQATSIIEGTAFHPELLLKEYIKVLYPDALPDYTLNYYKPMVIE